VIHFGAGTTILRREVLHDRPWSVIPMRVVADTGDLLALRDDRWEWKDRYHVAGQVAAGRLSTAEAEAVWRETKRVAALLDGDPTARWWPGWAGRHPSGWHPSGWHPSGWHPSGWHPSGWHPSG
jgi:hypothetical protein